MLTGDLVRPRLRKKGSRLEVDMLPASNRHWLKTAADLITLFADHRSQSRETWDASLEAYEGERIDYDVIRGLAKVLCDAASFEAIELPISPVEIRQSVFAMGPVFAERDLFHQQTAEEVFAAAAEQLQIEPEWVETALFADRPATYRLADIGPDWTPADLIQRYNLELARGVLYWASELHIDIHDTYKDFWRYLKLFKLMFWASPLPEGGYQVVLDGPISPFVKSTTRYGRQFAAFLPALFLCQRWSMDADTQYGGETLRYQLNEQIPLVSHFRGSGEFDSQWEADLAAEFAAKFGDERGKWILSREDEVLLLGDTVMLPDFSFTHKKDGRRALVEIVGFWHPEYLRRKVAKVRDANRRNLILVVYEGINLTADALEDVPGEVLYFKNKPVLKDVLAAVERVAE